MAEVLHLFQSPAHGQAMLEYDQVFAVENKGFEDCIHGRGGSSRQVLLMDWETLEEFGIAPGRAKENITTCGLALARAPLGQRLHIGEAVLEVSSHCTPCHQMDEIRPGLKEALHGRRGVLCRVVVSGRIRRGDRIETKERERVVLQT